MSERRTKTTSTISNVRVIPVPRVLVPISEIKYLETMRFVTLVLTTLGGALTAFYPNPYFLLGIFMISIGLLNEYMNVHNVTKGWTEHEPREVNVDDTGTDVSEYE